ncbi:hypothetical protein J2782_001663 [Brucella pseudogrignonensis]|uniref:Uncharacterized protein n=1 Tax=Brucella pseudogrignonensis TaxID=419475 RepID=A0ABU1M7N3_9HYPH|nr:hypothetical protein [Brucella pseudogrignonensis]
MNTLSFMINGRDHNPLNNMMTVAGIDDHYARLIN